MFIMISHFNFPYLSIPLFVRTELNLEHDLFVYLTFTNPSNSPDEKTR